MKWFLVLALSVAAFPQRIEPSRTVEDYPVHSATGDYRIGAEYHYRSFRAGNQSYYVKGHVVVEAALYGPKGARLDVTAGHFSLRLSGKRASLAQPPTTKRAKTSGVTIRP